MFINVILAVMIVISFLIAIPLHELGHALVASWLGDRTPQNEGRRSLSLRAHIDPVGLIMCLILAFQPAIQAGFGWGKPVKVDAWKLRTGPNIGVLLVACAGPIFSLIIGILAALLLRVLPAPLFANEVVERIPQFITVFASVNICLMLFNLLPLYPLDGYQIVYTLLPSRQAVQFAKSAPYGPFIILILFFLLPFLARLSGMGDFPLFQLAFYFREGSLIIIQLVSGVMYDIGALYAL